jgi:hypothetical protein
VSDAVADVRRAFLGERRLSDTAALLTAALRDADALGSGSEAWDVRAHLLHLAGSVLVTLAVTSN